MTVSISKSRTNLPEPVTIEAPQKVLANQAFSTSATFDEPMSTLLIGSVLLLGVTAHRVNLIPRLRHGMNFDVRIQTLDKLFEINNDVAAYWSKADQLLEEMEHATEGVEDGMVFYLASRDHSNSYLDESFYATRRLVDKYEALITETCYHGHPPLG